MTDTSEVPLNEPLAQYPELARARNLYIALFKDDAQLINLNYTAAQRKVAKPVLTLIQDPGEVLHPGQPYCYLSFMDETGAKRVGIYALPEKVGYGLLAVDDPIPAGLSGLIEALTAKPPAPVFDDYRVAEINLISNLEVTADLPRLIKAFYEGGYGLSQLRQENVLSRIARTLGKITTFRAQWTDDTRRDFVVELKPATKETKGSYYHEWRKLNPLSDLQGTVVPIGRKPNSSKEQILEVFNRQPERAFQGHIQWQPRTFVSSPK